MTGNARTPLWLIEQAEARRVSEMELLALSQLEPASRGGGALPAWLRILLARRPEPAAANDVTPTASRRFGV
jgi:hypothetical protein